MKKVVKINHTRNIFVEVADEWETLPEGIFKSVIGDYLSAGGLKGYFLKLKDEDGNIPYREDLDDLIVFEVLLDMIECWKIEEEVLHETGDEGINPLTEVVSDLKKQIETLTKINTSLVASRYPPLRCRSCGEVLFLSDKVNGSRGGCGCGYCYHE